ncbi:MAG: hypothetical protein ACR2G6_17325 [Gemmatimonadaceae bacterium]
MRLSRMMGERVRMGMFAGMAAAAATAGVLIGFGIARGAPWSLINSVAMIALGNDARFHVGFDAVTAVGLVVHVLSILLWGVVFAIVAWRLRRWWLAFAGLLFAGVVYGIDILLLPSRIAPGFESALSTPELTIVFATLGMSLAAGVALAGPGSDESAAGSEAGGLSH